MRKSDAFFKLLASQGLAVTYDEVRVKTTYSEVVPHEVNLASRFSRRVPLKVPVISAAMDTVTNHTMAIAMAKLGGLGVIHRSFAAKEQREEVRRVKFHLSGMIAKPIAVRADQTLAEIEAMRRERDFSFHSFPVVKDENDTLVGLLTKNDFDFSGDRSKKAQEVMTPLKELVTAKPSTTVNEALSIMRKAKKKVLPLVDGKGRLAGMYLLSDLNRIASGSSANFNVDENGRLRVGAAIGVGKDAFERVELLREYADVFVLDSAHGDSKNIINTIKELKSAYGKDVDIVAGNISEGDSAIRLAKAGADGIKVGQGPGSICTTRMVAGIGCPQVTAVHNVAKALESLKGGKDIPVCADGGIMHPGDLTIAIGAGGHSVMLGRVLAGTDEAPGTVETFRGRTVKFYRGMGSRSAMEEYRSSRDRYSQNDMGKEKLVPEGVESFIPYAGRLEMVMNRYVGGLRLGMGYTGSRTIEDLRQNADFYRITGAGLKESEPHDVEVLPEGSTREHHI